VESKQVNVSMPLKLYEETTKYIKSHGYKNVQDLMLESIRNRVIFQEEIDDSKWEINPEYEKEILSRNENDYLGIEESTKLTKKWNARINEKS